MSVVYTVIEEAINPGITYVGSNEKSIDMYIHTPTCTHRIEITYVCSDFTCEYGDKCVYMPTCTHRRTETTYVCTHMCEHGDKSSGCPGTVPHH